MKPLSIGSAVVGLIAGVFRIAPILYHFITHTQGAPKTASQILDEVNSITLALERLQVYVMGAVNANVAWRTMLSLRNIVATLTACVVTYSDLERVVNKCVDEGKVKRVKWLINEGEIVELVQRAQSHKLSVTLMLTILQYESMQEAESSIDRLIDVVEGLIASNVGLRSWIDGLAANSTAAQDPTQLPYTIEDLTLSTSSQSGSAFESDLDTSRVYRKLQSRASIWSLSTSQQGPMALTAFSDLTMDNVSNISVVRLPIWSVDLCIASDYDVGLDENYEPDKRRRGLDHQASTAYFEADEAALVGWQLVNAIRIGEYFWGRRGQTLACSKPNLVFPQELHQSSKTQ